MKGKPSCSWCSCIGVSSLADDGVGCPEHLAAGVAAGVEVDVAAGVYVEGAAGAGCERGGDCVDNCFVACFFAVAAVSVGVGVDDVLFAGGGGVGEFDCEFVACHGGDSSGGVVGSPAAGVATVGKEWRRGKLGGGLDVDGGCHHCAVAGFACCAVALPDFDV